MTWCDWTNEDWDFDNERYEDDPYNLSRHPFGAEYEATFHKPAISRSCTRCDHNFKSAYPCACPECGGWTETITDFTEV